MSGSELKLRRTAPSHKPTAGFWWVEDTEFFIGRFIQRPVTLGTKPTKLVVLTTPLRAWRIWSTDARSRRYLRSVGLYGVRFPSRREAFAHLSLALDGSTTCRRPHT
jgi:hypothetical protein